MLSKNADVPKPAMALPADVPSEDMDFHSLAVRDPGHLVRFLKERTGMGHTMAVSVNSGKGGYRFLYISRSNADRADFLNTADYVLCYVLAKTPAEHYAKRDLLLQRRRDFIEANGGFNTLSPYTLGIYLGAGNTPDHLNERIVNIAVALNRVLPDIVFFGLRGTVDKGFQLGFSSTVSREVLLKHIQTELPDEGLVLYARGMTPEERASKERIEKLLADSQRMNTIDNATTVEEIDALIREMRLENPAIDDMVYETVRENTDAATADAIIESLRKMSLEEEEEGGGAKTDTMIV